MFGLLEGFGKRRGRGRDRGPQGLQRLEKKIERLQARAGDPRAAEKIQRLQSRLERKRARWQVPNATTAAATSGAAGVPPTLAVSTTPAAVAATAALPPVMPPYPAGTIPPANWNEAAYLNKHPDVARGVNGGTIPSGLWHYMVSGQKEGRALSGLGNTGGGAVVQLAVAGMTMSNIYHGYRRNNSVVWALLWGLLGPVGLALSLAQGYGKPKN